MLQPAVQPVEVLGDKDLEPACSRIVEHLLIAGAVIVAAADCGVRVDLDRGPTLPFNILTVGMQATWKYAELG